MRQLLAQRASECGSAANKLKQPTLCWRECPTLQRRLRLTHHSTPPLCCLQATPVAQRRHQRHATPAATTTTTTTTSSSSRRWSRRRQPAPCATRRAVSRMQWSCMGCARCSAGGCACGLASCVAAGHAAARVVVVVVVVVAAAAVAAAVLMTTAACWTPSPQAAAAVPQLAAAVVAMTFGLCVAPGWAFLTASCSVCWAATGRARRRP
jgi:hypothetical protein